MLPGKAADPGVTAADNRQFPGAVLWRFRTGSPRRDLPGRFGNWNSVFRRFRRWALKGVFERVFNALSDGSGLEYVFVARHDRPGATRRHLGQRGDPPPGGPDAPAAA